MIGTEDILTFSETAKRLPEINGRRIAAATLWRWARRGLKGVRLESRKLGGRYVTSIEAVDRFAARLAELNNSSSAAPAAQQTRPRRNQRRESDVNAAEGRVAAAGIA